MDWAHQSWPPSLWAATAPRGPDCPALEHDEETETAIIGGGFTGLSAALHLARDGHSVRVLEAVEPAWGASGRNGGQVNPGWKILPSQMVARYGKQRGQRVANMANATCGLVFDLIAAHDIACDAVRPGYIQGAFAKRGRTAQQRWVREWSPWDEPARLLSKTELSELVGCDAYDGGLLDRRGGNVQPLAYARGLAHAALGAGALIHSSSPARSIERRGQTWIVHTPLASLRSRNVLICTNGYTQDLWPGLRRAIVPVASFIAATHPLGDHLRRSVLPGLHAVSETRRVQVYYRMDAQGRFVIGGRGNLFDAAQMGDDKHVRDTAGALFAQLRGVGWEFHWGGYVAMTRDSAPHLMQPAKGVLAGMGYNGRGIAMATMMGKQLALAVLGEDPDMPIEPLYKTPFHALRQLGVSWHLLSSAFLDRLEQ